MRSFRILILLFILFVPAGFLAWGLGALNVKAAPAILTSITIVKEANPADGTDFLFTTDALPLGQFLFKWGSSGTGNGQLDFPYGIVVDPSGSSYVSDFTNDRVQKFDSDGNYQSKWGAGSTEGLVDGPTGLAIDGSGNVYVVESTNNRVQVFDSSGNFVRMWGWDVTSGNITTTFEVCTSSCKAGVSGSGDGQFTTPAGIALDSAGNVYVADATTDFIQKFDSSGNFLSKWGATGTAEGAFNSPTGIAIDTADNLYVTDAFNNRVQVFDTSGAFIRTWGWDVTIGGGTGFEICTSSCKAGVYGSGNGQLARPEGIAFDSFGRVFVADRENDRVQVFSGSGSYLDQWGGTGTGNGLFITPGWLTLDSLDRVYVSDGFNDRIQVFGPKFYLDDAVPTDGDTITSTRVFTGLAAGSYHFTETLTAGTEFVLKDISCAGGTATTNLAGAAVTVDLLVGENVVCTFTNNISTIIIVKDASPADGTDFSFQVNAEAYLGQWGTSGSGNAQFDTPRGVALGDSGSVYVVDSNNDRIQKFDGRGAYLTQWGGLGSGNGQFFAPWGVAVDGSENVYVSDFSLDRIQKFDSSGAYLAQWGITGTGEGQFDQPKGLVVDGAGNVYVADGNNHRIQVFDSSGTFQEMWGWGVDGGAGFEICTSACSSGSSGAGNGQFNNPNGLAVDGAGNVFVADTGNHRIQVFDSSGTYLTKWGALGLNPGQFSGPQGVAVDGTGKVYVPDYGNHRVQVFDSSGVFLKMWGWGVNGGTGFEVCTGACAQGIQGSGNGQFFQPWGVAVGPIGNVYVADSGNDRIQLFNGLAFDLDDANPDDGDLITNQEVFTGWLPGTYTFTEIIPDGGWELSDLACLGGSTTPDVGSASVVIEFAEGDYVVCKFKNVGPGSITIVKDAFPSRGQDFTFETNIPLSLSSGDFQLMWGWGVDTGANSFEICTSGCQAGTFGDGAGQMSPWAIATNSLGEVYVTDPDNFRIQKFDGNGTFLSAWGWGVATGASAYEICTSNCQAGIFGDGAGQFGYAYGIGIDSAGSVYVTDAEYSRVQKFDSNGNFQRMWGWDVISGNATTTFEICTVAANCKAGSTGSGTGQFHNPEGISIDKFGNVYVADSWNNRILVFGTSGNYVKTIGSYGLTEGFLASPWDVAADGDGNIYVVEGAFRVQKFDSSGSFLRMWGWDVTSGNITTTFEICTSGCKSGVSGNGPGQFSGAYGISIDEVGNVYVSDRGFPNERIQRFDSSGAYLAQWGSRGTGEGQFEQLIGMEVDSSGNLYAAEYYNHRVQKLLAVNHFFTLDDAVPDDGDGITSTVVFTNLLADTYTFEELLPPGWDLTDITCAGGSTTVDLANQKVDVDLSLGDEVVCTFSNTGPGYITIVKDAIPADGTNFQFLVGGDLTGYFTLDDAVPDDADGITSTIVLSDMPAGEYIFTDILPSGWFLDDLSCSGGSTTPDIGAANVTVNLSDGEDVVCTFTNKAYGSITIIKDANPPDGTDFSFTTTALISGAFVLDDAVPDDMDSFTSTRVITGLVAGTYGFIEVLPAGWDLSDITCGGGSWTPNLATAALQVDLNVGEDVVCTFTNTKQATITIIKDADPADGTNFGFTTNAQTAGAYKYKWGGIGQPRDIAVDSGGNVYVVEWSSNRVRVFDNTGAFVTQWGSYGSGDGQFDLPVGISIGPSGDVYVADTFNNRIQRFDSSGTYLGQWGGFGSADGQFSFPRGVAVDSTGNVYVVDTSNYRIQKFDSSGVFLNKWGSSGFGDGQFNFPIDVAVDRDDNVYVVDSYNHRIQVFDSSGTFLNKWGGFGFGNGLFYEPISVYVDVAGKVYVTDSLNDRVQVFDSSGAYLGQWGGFGSADGQLYQPNGIAVDLAGVVFVADYGNSRIQAFNSSTFGLDDAQPDDGDIITDTLSISLDLGTYTVTEHLPDGWSLGSLVCDTGSWSADILNARVVVSPSAGNTITCTFGNTTTPPAPPAPVNDLAIQIAGSDVQLDWSAVVSDVNTLPTTVSLYHVYRDTSPDMTGAVLITSTTFLTHTDSGAGASSTTYYYGVIAEDTGGLFSDWSNLVGKFTFILVPT